MRFVAFVHQPCCLKLLRLLLELINIVLCVYALPAWCVLILTRSIVINDGYFTESVRNNALRYLFIGWLGRFLVVALFIAVRERAAADASPRRTQTDRRVSVGAFSVCLERWAVFHMRCTRSE